MGRLKALNPLLCGKYKKLLDDYGSKDCSKLLLHENVDDFISYSCGHCGHTQKLQAEELNSIVGHAFRLAYAAHIQKSAGILRDVISPKRSSKSASCLPKSALSSPHYNHSYRTSHEPKSQCQSINCSALSHSRCISHTSQAPRRINTYTCSGSSLTSVQQKHNQTHTHVDQKPCDSSCDIDQQTCQRGCFPALSSSSEVASALHQQSEKMRTPGAPLQDGEPSEGSTLFKGTLSLPELQQVDEENNLPHSPDSDISNSPTELNNSRRFGDKPVLVKNVGLSNGSTLSRIDNDFHIDVTCATSCSSGLAKSVFLSHNSSLGISCPMTTTRVVGYVNQSASCSLDCLGHGKKEITGQGTDAELLKCMSHLSFDTSDDIRSDTDVCVISSSPQQPPPLPERSDSLLLPEESDLRSAAWFQAGIPREIALEVLSQEPVGAFLVRESSTKPGCYALSLRVPPRDESSAAIAHYLIVKSSKGYRIKGFTKDFSSLTALITHHSVMPELLPCPLSLNRYNPSYAPDDSRTNDGSDDDPDYNTLSDFRKVMADLNV